MKICMDHSSLRVLESGAGRHSISLVCRRLRTDKRNFPFVKCGLVVQLYTHLTPVEPSPFLSCS